MKLARVVLRVVLGVALAFVTSGCFVLLGNPIGGIFQREHRFDEDTIDGEGKDKVLVIDISSVITDTPSKHAFGLIEEEGTVGRVVAELKKADGDERVKAIVLRINSPGGGVTASDDIYSEIVRFKRKHNVPVVAGLGDLAASGGYYVACAADQIVARPTTVTGSIGVIMMNLNLEGLLGKIGVRNDTYKAGAHKDILSPFRGATPEERRMIQAILDDLHGRFIAVVREARPKLDPAHVSEITDGRIFDADQAVAVGLVDRVGGLREAIDVARRAAGLEKARVVMYRRPDEARENIYSLMRGAPAQVNLMPVDLAGLAGPGPRFMYLWAPGL